MIAPVFVGLLSSEDTLAVLPNFGDTPDAIRADLDALTSNQPAQTGSVDQVGISDSVPNYPDPVGLVAGAARAIHLRRQLAQAAEHGAALLASLGLPRLVTPGFAPLDPAAIGDAVDRAIAALDAMDGDPEAEPWLGWSTDGRGVVQLGDALDREAVNEDGDALDDGEHDTADLEPWIGRPEDPDAVLSDAFQADHDAEADDADDEPEAPANLSWVFGPSRREAARV